ncbi:hypothetical protein NDU88_001875 [Pleurodeles waltl]|uniref:Uncharacterized protein n=1 Tax=Pleurodeles waltl TaxID=8319 RepID=A0AAV7NC16_PLEWA|nr:hypothetical protein NDU88_001875 [Pleurodeles waltl]
MKRTHQPALCLNSRRRTPNGTYIKTSVALRKDSPDRRCRACQDCGGSGQIFSRAIPHVPGLAKSSQHGSAQRAFYHLRLGQMNTLRGRRNRMPLKLAGSRETRTSGNMATSNLLKVRKPKNRSYYIFPRNRAM